MARALCRCPIVCVCLSRFSSLRWVVLPTAVSRQNIQSDRNKALLWRSMEVLMQHAALHTTPRFLADRSRTVPTAAAEASLVNPPLQLTVHASQSKKYHLCVRSHHSNSSFLPGHGLIVSVPYVTSEVMPQPAATARES